MATFDNMRDFLMDFGIVPKFVDIPTLIKMYRSCKLWEWVHGENYLIDRIISLANKNGNERISHSPLHLDGDTPVFDYSVSLGNLSLTSW